MSDENWFAREMEKVRPLNKEKSRAQTSNATTTSKKHQLLRQLENRDGTHTHHHANRSHQPQRAEEWLLRGDGISAKEIKTLAQANISFELDLHGMTQDEATAKMGQFVSAAIAQNIRQICIVHGRGNHSTGKSVLKEVTYQWLEQGTFSGHILAAIPSAQSKGGACNILLRKKKPA